MSVINLLQEKATNARKDLLKVVHHAGAGHIGGPLSAIDILTTLYFNEMNVDPSNPKDAERDRFILSKGHSAIGLYAVLAERGYLPNEELFTFDSLNSRLQGHPDMKALPGIEMSTGSLGQGISAAVGMALGAKLQNQGFRTYCMIGDGESQEGQVWEAAFIAPKYNLDNLVVIVDYNKLQQYGWPGTDTERSAPNDLFEEKWLAFGWHVIRIDGHSYADILQAFEEAKSTKEKPTVIIADTVKGKGISFMEGNYLWHSKVPSDEELANALAELNAVGGL
ncbi:transketolase [Lysinibacillus louembei]|uniref:Transketolase n=1 Tax=Lysinibacillus louembei TaxID=1470088 RepID=A0ABZ0RZV9_9BACI|nr:transketolase [Lysinibacillus louembei]WPK12832.1 transketolase [Lysinibacillus louembei]